MTDIDWSDWPLLFVFPVAAIGSLALIGLAVLVFFGANLVVGYVMGERRHIRHITVTRGLEGFAGLLGWWLGAFLAVGGPTSLLLAFTVAFDRASRQRELSLQAAAIRTLFAIIGLCLMRMSNKDGFRIRWPAIHSHSSARRRVALMRCVLVLWEWFLATGFALFVLTCLSRFEVMPEPLSSKPTEVATWTQIAVAAAIGAVWATFSLLRAKSRCAAQEIISTVPPD